MGEWRIPKEKLIAIDSRVAHMDNSFWNTGNMDKNGQNTGNTAAKEEPYPLSQFWAARFLEYPDDPTSGPLKFKKRKSKNTAVDVFNGPLDNRPRFTMDGLSGAWLPFGGGSRQCPGRNFAKQEILLSFAMMVSIFDFELVLEPNGRKVSIVPDMKYYGLGTFPPKGKTPFRIRRRM